MGGERVDPSVFAYSAYTYCCWALSAIIVAACLSCSFLRRWRRKKKTTMPAIAARASTAPATAPAIAPPLIRVKSAGEGEGDGMEMVVLLWSKGVESNNAVVDASCPKAVTPADGEVSTVLLYPFIAAQPKP